MPKAKRQAEPVQDTDVVWHGNEILRPFLRPITDLREDPDRTIERVRKIG